MATVKSAPELQTRSVYANAARESWMSQPVSWHILTAEHVIEDASSVMVKLQDGNVRTARALGRDSSTDIALLKIDPSGLALHPLALGSLKSLEVGDRVFAISDPFGYARSRSSGLVSGLGRSDVDARLESPRPPRYPNALSSATMRAKPTRSAAVAARSLPRAWLSGTSSSTTT